MTKTVYHQRPEAAFKTVSHQLPATAAGPPAKTISHQDPPTDFGGRFSVRQPSLLRQNCFAPALVGVAVFDVFAILMLVGVTADESSVVL